MTSAVLMQKDVNSSLSKHCDWVDRWRIQMLENSFFYQHGTSSKFISPLYCITTVNNSYNYFVFINNICHSVVDFRQFE